jgi:hypothetical protein
MTKNEMRALASQALVSIDAGLVCLKDLTTQYSVPDADAQSVAKFFADAGEDVRQIRDDPTS